MATDNGVMVSLPGLDGEPFLDLVEVLPLAFTKTAVGVGDQVLHLTRSIRD